MIDCMIKKVINKILKQNNPVSRFSLRLYRKYRVRSFTLKDHRVLDIAGGSMPLSSEYLNVDISNAPTVDVVTNLLEPLPFDENYVDKVVSVATLEHFNVNDNRKILSEFLRVLKPGGVLEIGVPSLQKIIEQYNKRGCDDEVLRYLHGALKDQYDVHFFVVDAERFISELTTTGFIDAKQVEYDFPRHSADFMMKLVAKKPS